MTATLGKVPERIVDELAKADERELTSLYRSLFREQKMPLEAWHALNSLVKQAASTEQSLCVYERPDVD